MLFIKSLALSGLVGLTTSFAMQVDPSTPFSIVPTVNLVSIVIGAMTMGMLFNRVRELERRMNKTQRRVFHEDDED